MAATSGPEARVSFFEVRDAPELLANRLAALPVRIRLGGLGWALIEVREADRAAVAARLPSAKLLLQASNPVELFAVWESELTASGRAECERYTLYRSPSENLRVIALPARPPSAIESGGRGTRILPTDEHIGGAHAELLPESMSPRALAPLPPAERANPYRRSRLADPRVRARAVQLAGQVDSARILRIARELSTGPEFTRFSCRDEVNSFAGQYLLDTLQSIFSAPGDQVIIDPFTIDCSSVPVEIFNIIARRPGERPGSGRYILSAHYDATARNTPGWDRKSDPAPGADDNGSGVGCIIEAARILLQERYDFDIELALFSGEELGLLGSRSYTDDSLSALGDVLGVINLDMVGYNPREVDSLNAVTNYTSEWLADLLIEAESALDNQHGLTWFDKILQPSFARSDHAPFWSHGQSAVLLIENIDIDAHNPNYHRTSDTFEQLAGVEGGDLMRRVTEVTVAALGQYAISTQPEPQFEVPPTGVLLFRPDGRLLIEAVAGQAVRVHTRVINSGQGEDGPIDVHGTLHVGGSVVAEGDTTLGDWGGGVWREVILGWTPGTEPAGTQEVRVDLTLRKQGNPIATLSGTTSIDIVPLAIREAVVAPNPVRGSLAAARLVLVRLNGEADIHCQILDALGKQVGRFDGHVTQSQSVPLDQMVEPPDLPSGIYVLLVDVRLPGQQVVVGSRRLTFAYMR